MVNKWILLLETGHRQPPPSPLPGQGFEMLYLRRVTCTYLSLLNKILAMSDIYLFSSGMSPRPSPLTESTVLYSGSHTLFMISHAAILTVAAESISNIEYRRHNYPHLGAEAISNIGYWRKSLVRYLYRVVRYRAMYCSSRISACVHLWNCARHIVLLGTVSVTLLTSVTVKSTNI